MDNKLERKPYSYINPLSNTSKFESLNNIKSTLTEIDKNLKNDIKKGGVPLYYYGDKVYVDSSDSHTLIIGATGSKKTRLLVLPTCMILAKAGESMIITDPKAEIYERTAKRFQAYGYKIEVVNFRDPSVGNCWNPFTIPHKFYKEGKKDTSFEFINDMSTNLFISQLNNLDPYWENSASDLFFGLTSLAMRLSSDDHEINIRDIIELRHKFFLKGNKPNLNLLEIAKEDIVTSQSLLGVVTAPDDTRQCILSVFDQKMRMFSYQDNLLEMVSSTTISMDSIGNQKTIIYLIMPDEKTTLHPLISLFVKQSYEYLIYTAQKNADKKRASQKKENENNTVIDSPEEVYGNEGMFKVRINYILDEFSALPKIGDFPAMITAARSRNIRFNLIVQSGTQLLSRYKEEASTIKGNCNNWIFLYSKEVDLLEEISKLCGNNEKSMPLISILALQHLDKDKGEAIVLSNRLFPIIAYLADIHDYDEGEFEPLGYTDDRSYQDTNTSLYSIWNDEKEKEYVERKNREKTKTIDTTVPPLTVPEEFQKRKFEMEIGPRRIHSAKEAINVLSSVVILIASLVILIWFSTEIIQIRIISALIILLSVYDIFKKTQDMNDKNKKKNPFNW